MFIYKFYSRRKAFYTDNILASVTYSMSASEWVLQRSWASPGMGCYAKYIFLNPDFNSSYKLPEITSKLDGVGPIDNRPSTD